MKQFGQRIRAVFGNTLFRRSLALLAVLEIVLVLPVFFMILPALADDCLKINRPGFLNAED